MSAEIQKIENEIIALTQKLEPNKRVYLLMDGDKIGHEIAFRTLPEAIHKQREWKSLNYSVACFTFSHNVNGNQ